MLEQHDGQMAAVSWLLPEAIGLWQCGQWSDMLSRLCHVPLGLSHKSQEETNGRRPPPAPCPGAAPTRRWPVAFAAPAVRLSGYRRAFFRITRESSMHRLHPRGGRMCRPLLLLAGGFAFSAALVGAQPP